jgi:hypothetical protein
MKKILLSLFTILTAAVVGTSCVSDDIVKPTPPVTEGGFMLDLKVENGSLTRNTTVVAEPGEADINSLYLLFFEAGGNQNFIGQHNASPTNGNPLDITSKIKVEFEVGSPLNHTTPYKILIVANIHAYVTDKDTWLASFEGMSYNEARQTTLNIHPSGGDGVTEIKQNNLLMTAAVDKDPSGTDVQATLVRTFTRLDVDLHDTKHHTLTSVSVWNVARVTGVWSSEYNSYSQHTQKFANAVVINGEQVKGSLYAFENRVAKSEQDDASTTCLIIGIDNGAGTTYYRINIVSDAIGQQHLKRNFVFNVGIRRVLAEGAPTPEAAYKSTGSPALDYTINNWDPDGGGLVMTDPWGNVLAIPTNNINFGAAGGEAEYQIFTYSADPLMALGLSGMNLPDGITAVLSGNLLRVKALPSGESKTGYVDLVFGPELKGRININQIGDSDAYLELSVGTNGIPRFIASASEWSGNVIVSSSGAWTASLYSPEFKFIRHIAGPGAVADNSASGYDGDTFSVATATNNAAPNPRFGFVIVTLNSNPDLNRVLVLNQAGTAGVTLTPEHRQVWFAANGTPEGANQNIFRVNTGGEDWSVQLSGNNADKFEVIEDKDLNTIEIRALQNTEAVELQASVRVYLSEMNIVATTVELRQRAQVLLIEPATVPNISFSGGTTPAITVTSSQPWEVEIGGGNPFGASTNVSGGSNGDSFTVTVPALPHNVADGRTITVRVFIPGTNVQRTMTVTQNPRRARDIRIVTGVNAVNAFSSSASTANQRRSARLRTEIISPANFGRNVSTSTVFSGDRTIVTPITVNPAAQQADIYLANSAGTGTSGYNAARAAEVRNWLTARADRVLIATNQAANGGFANLMGGTWGYVGAQGGAANGANSVHRVRPEIVNGTVTHPVLDYLFRTGPFMPAGVTDISDLVALMPDNATGGTLTSWPSTFVPIIMHPGNNGRVVMGIDPVRRIVYYGNGIFGSGDGSNTANWNTPANVAFVRNLAAWMIEVTQYGEEFTIQFIP